MVGLPLDGGHTIEHCRHLKDEIEELIKRGYLRQFIASGGRSEHRTYRKKIKDRREDKKPKKEDSEVFRSIHHIGGGFASRGSRRAINDRHIKEALAPPPPRAFTSKADPIILFTDYDYEGIRTTHDDALVITA